MSPRGKFIFAGCVVFHALVSAFSLAWCAGVSMAILDSGGTEAPPSLIAVCRAEFIFNLPLSPLTRHLFWRLAASGPPIFNPIYWIIALLNSFLAISIIFLAVCALRRLFSSRRARLAPQ